MNNLRNLTQEKVCSKDRLLERRKQITPTGGFLIGTILTSVASDLACLLSFDMEHAKKMFLVDSRFDLRNESYHDSALDQAINSIINSDLPEREKQLQYNQALQRYRINLANLESVANEPVKVQTTAEEKSVKDKISETVATEEKAKALQVYDDLSVYTPLTVDKQGRLIQDGTVIEDSNLVDLIAHDVKTNKKGQKQNFAWEIFSTAKKQMGSKKGKLLTSRGKRSSLKKRWVYI